MDRESVQTARYRPVGLLAFSSHAFFSCSPENENDTKTMYGGMAPGGEGSGRYLSGSENVAVEIDSDSLSSDAVG